MELSKTQKMIKEETLANKNGYSYYIRIGNKFDSIDEIPESEIYESNRIGQYYKPEDGEPCFVPICFRSLSSNLTEDDAQVCINADVEAGYGHEICFTKPTPSQIKRYLKKHYGVGVWN